MQITIKDSLIKRILSDEVYAILEKRNPKLVNEIFADPKFQRRLAKEISSFVNEYDAYEISEMIQDIEIPQLTKIAREKWAVDNANSNC